MICDIATSVRHDQLVRAAAFVHKCVLSLIVVVFVVVVIIVVVGFNQPSLSNSSVQASTVSEFIPNVMFLD